MAELVMTAQASVAFAGDGLHPVTPDYKHVGSFQDPNCSLRHELRLRGAQLKYAAVPLRRNILCCPWTDLRVCRMLALSFVLSKGRTTWVAWPPLGVRDYKKVQVDYNNVWRGVLRANMFAGSPRLADEQILARVDALDATLARRVDWLQYLRRLLLHAPEALLAALQAEQGAVGSRHSQIPLDLLWVRQVIPGLAHLPCPRVQVSDWSDYILLHDEWLGIVRRAADLHRGLVRNQVEARAWLRRFHCKVECIGLWRHSIPQAVLQETFCCPQCVEVFSSYQQMAAHRAARHCFRNLASFYAGGTCCMACAREFHHSKALFDHLNYVRTGCLCTWACLTLPCAMPAVVRHAGCGADSNF